MNKRFRDPANDRGLALPISLSILTVAILLVTAVSGAAIAGLHQSKRGADSRAALAAAKAGIATAANRLGSAAPDENSCAVVESDGSISVGPPDPQLAGWCEAQSETLDDAGTSYVTRISLGALEEAGCQRSQKRRVVSVGRAADVTRRVIAYVATPVGSVFSSCALIAPQVARGGGDAREWIRGNVATNGEARLKGSLTVCGNVYASQVIEGSGGLVECGDKHEQPGGGDYSLNDVPAGCAQGKPWGHDDCNNDERIVEVADNVSPPDPLNYDAAIRPAASPGQVKWGDTGVRELDLSGVARLTLRGNTYSFCKLKLSEQAKLYVAPRDPTKPVRIFIEDPADCELGPNEDQLDTGGTSGIINLTGDPTMVQIYMVGTDDPAYPNGTHAHLGGNPTRQAAPNGDETWMELVIYAPHSKVTVDLKMRILGAIAAKEGVLLKNSMLVWSREVTKLSGANFSVVPTYTVHRFSECPPPPDGSPDSVTMGCSQ